MLRKALLTVVAAASSLLPVSALGESDDWIQVEVLLFKHLDENAGNGEKWPEHPTLTYPQPLRRLTDPQAAERERKKIEDAAWAKLAMYPIPVAANFDEDNNGLETIPDDVQQDTSVQDVQADEPADEDDTPDLELEAPFVVLDSADLELNDAFQRLRWSKNYQPSALIGWRQPMPGRKNTVSVPVFGGERSDNHAEIEGSITIRKSAYMHASANLWLNIFGPPRPTGPYAFKLESDIALPDLPEPLTPEVDVDTLLLPYNATDLATRLNSDGSSRWTGLEEVSVTASRIPYAAAPTQSLTLEEDRRLGAGDVHYFDHPRFGAILKVTPFDPVKAAQVRLAQETGTEAGADAE